MLASYCYSKAFPSIHAMSSNALQISSQFTEDCVATAASLCEHVECTTIIQPGEKCFYVAPHSRPDKPRKNICKPCMIYYLNKLSITAHVILTATVSGNVWVLNLVMSSANFSVALAQQNADCGVVPVLGSKPAHTHHQIMGALPNPNSGNSSQAIDMASIQSLINQSQRWGRCSSHTDVSLQTWIYCLSRFTYSPGPCHRNAWAHSNLPITSFGKQSHIFSAVFSGWHCTFCPSVVTKCLLWLFCLAPPVSGRVSVLG